MTTPGASDWQTAVLMDNTVVAHLPSFHLSILGDGNTLGIVMTQESDVATVVHEIVL